MALTDDEVRMIYLSTEKGVVLAERYEVAPTVITAIWQGTQRRFLRLTADFPRRCKPAPLSRYWR